MRYNPGRDNNSLNRSGGKRLSHQFRSGAGGANRRRPVNSTVVRHAMTMLRKQFLFAIFVLAAFATNARVVAKPKQVVTAQIFLTSCAPSEKVSVPINRSYNSGVSIGGKNALITSHGGSPACDYSYSFSAYRLPRNRVKLTLNVSIQSQSVEKHIVLIRGKTVDIQLASGVRLVAGF